MKLILLVNSQCCVNCVYKHHHWYEDQLFLCPYQQNKKHTYNLAYNSAYISSENLFIWDNFIYYYKLEGRECESDYIINDLKKYIFDIAKKEYSKDNISSLEKYYNSLN